MMRTPSVIALAAPMPVNMALEGSTGNVFIARDKNPRQEVDGDRREHEAGERGQGACEVVRRLNAL